MDEQAAPPFGGALGLAEECPADGDPGVVCERGVFVTEAIDRLRDRGEIAGSEIGEFRYALNKFAEARNVAPGEVTLAGLAVAREERNRLVDARLAHLSPQTRKNVKSRLSRLIAEASAAGLLELVPRSVTRSAPRRASVPSPAASAGAIVLGSITLGTIMRETPGGGGGGGGARAAAITVPVLFRAASPAAGDGEASGSAAATTAAAAAARHSVGAAEELFPFLSPSGRLRPGVRLLDAQRQFGLCLVRDALARSGGRGADAARELGLNPQTLAQRVASYRARGWLSPRGVGGGDGGGA